MAAKFPYHFTKRKNAKAEGKPARVREGGRLKEGRLESAADTQPKTACVGEPAIACRSGPARTLAGASLLEVQSCVSTLPRGRCGQAPERKSYGQSQGADAGGGLTSGCWPFARQHVAAGEERTDCRLPPGGSLPGRTCLVHRNLGVWMLVSRGRCLVQAAPYAQPPPGAGPQQRGRSRGRWVPWHLRLQQGAMRADLVDSFFTHIQQRPREISTLL